MRLTDFATSEVRKTTTFHIHDDLGLQWKLRILCWVGLILPAAVQSWLERQLMSGDGVSYLDIGDAYFRADWQNAINAMWSPLYSWLTGLAFWLIKPSMAWEYPTAHLVNFILFLGALAAYEFFLTQLINTKQWPFRVRTVRVLGYALFAWSSLILISIRNITADYLVSIVVFLVCGILLQIRAAKRGWQTFGLLGALLGIGYLAKAPMFPLAFVFMGAMFFLMRNVRNKEGIKRVAITFLVFLLFAAPFIFVLSKHQNRLTFSDSGRLNYIWWVNGINPRHWQGGTSNNGSPLHPTRQIYEHPAVYEFSSPVGGTYPPWFDPTYWYQGASPHFDLMQQAKAIFRNSWVALSELVFTEPGPLVFSGLFLLFYVTKSWRLALRNTGWYLGILIPTVLALLLFLFVHFEVRYIAPFLVTGLMTVFISFRPGNRKVFGGVALIILVAVMLSIGVTTAGYVYRSVRGQGTSDWEIAQSLHRQGLRPGDEIATTGSGITNASWARLARLRINAEVFSNRNDEFWFSRRNEFWSSTPEVRQQVIAILAQTGAKALVSDNVPQGADTSGWERVGLSNYYVYLMR